MDHENNENHNYASKGAVAGALATAVATAAVEAVQIIPKLVEGMNGGGRGERCDHYVTKTEAALMAENAELKSEKMHLESSIYTDKKITDTYVEVIGEVRKLEARVNAQDIYNATNTATLNCLAGQVAQLLSLTKVIIPATNICPAPMPQYNSWTAPTAAAG